MDTARAAPPPCVVEASLCGEGARLCRSAVRLCHQSHRVGRKLNASPARRAASVEAQAEARVGLVVAGCDRAAERSWWPKAWPPMCCAAGRRREFDAPPTGAPSVLDAAVRTRSRAACRRRLCAHLPSSEKGLIIDGGRRSRMLKAAVVAAHITGTAEASLRADSTCAPRSYLYLRARALRPLRLSTQRRLR